LGQHNLIIFKKALMEKGTKMKEIPIFYDWLNEITDEIEKKADSLNLNYWEAAGLRDDAPKEVKKAFEEYIKENEYYRGNTTISRPL